MPKPWGLTNGRLSRGSQLHPAARRQRPWRVLAILLLGLLAAGASQTAPAQAAPLSGSISVFMVAEQVGVQHTLCVGDQVQLRVTVQKKLVVPGRGPAPVLLRLGSVDIAASVGGTSGVGTISPPQVRTDLNNTPVGAAYFTFTAAKPGAAYVTFKGAVANLEFLGVVVTTETVTAHVNLTIEDCHYRLSVTSTWRVKGDAKITLVALVKFAGVALGEHDKYQATVGVAWLASAGKVGTCTGMVIPESQATMEGIIIAGQLVIAMDYAPAPVKLDVDCQEGPSRRPVELRPASLDIRVPSIGGGTSRSQLISGPGDTRGNALITVTKVDKP